MNRKDNNNLIRLASYFFLLSLFFLLSCGDGSGEADATQTEGQNSELNWNQGNWNETNWK